MRRRSKIPEGGGFAAASQLGSSVAVSADLELARRLADAADAISLPRFRSGLADRDEARPHARDRGGSRGRGRAAPDPRRRATRTTRSSARSRAPPGPARAAGSSTRSTATRNYARGIPVWGTLIALEEDGRRPARRGLGAGCSHGAGGPSAGPAPSRTASGSTSPPSRGSRTRCCRSRSRTACRRSRGARGTRAASATSGRTCSSPRAASTGRSTRSA